MNTIKKSHGISQKPCVKVLPIHEMDMGLASDACVATHARSTGVERLAGRPGPHGRQSLRTAGAADKGRRSGSRWEVFPYGLA